jgi:hypothetical protein
VQTALQDEPGRPGEVLGPSVAENQPKTKKIITPNCQSTAEPRNLTQSDAEIEESRFINLHTCPHQRSDTEALRPRSQTFNLPARHGSHATCDAHAMQARAQARPRCCPKHCEEERRPERNPKLKSSPKQRPWPGPLSRPRKVPISNVNDGLRGTKDPTIVSRPLSRSLPECKKETGQHQ